MSAIRALGLSVRCVDGEWRITYRLEDARLGVAVVGPISRARAIERAEAVAYYTSDRSEGGREDAIATARMMAERQA